MSRRKNIPFEKSFASHAKAQYWSDKNELKPEYITLKSINKFIFNCNNKDCGHEFITSPNTIIYLDRWCIYCCVPSKYLCEDINCKICLAKSFASHKMAKYWSDKNELKPNQVFKNSNSKIWFDCQDCKHSFDSVLSTISKGCWCPYCSNPAKQLCGKEDCIYCFNNSFASHEKAKFWNNELNGDIKPINIFKTGRNKYYFNCNDCGHTIYSELSEITKGRWCAYCSHYYLCNNNECSKCFEASFASHEKSNMWSEKNENITPRQVLKCSGKKYWLKCNDCLHDFQSSLSHIMHSKSKLGKFCPICNGKLFCDNLDCKICFEKSFASHPKAKYFSIELNNGLTPGKLSKNSNEKYWFDCECGHKFESALHSIVAGSWCPYCAFPSPKLCNSDSCINCLNKSFMSIPNHKYLEDKTINPRLIYKGSQTKYNFICDKGHKFLMKIASITNGCFCPKCVNKTEHKLYEELIKIYNNLIFQFKTEWCRNELSKRKCHLPYDFAIEERKIIIELDGEQHFKQVQKWTKPEEIRNRDKYKMKLANDNHYSVIRITQEYVAKKNSNWLVELMQNIDKVISEKKVQNVYICKKNEYQVFQEK